MHQRFLTGFSNGIPPVRLGVVFCAILLTFPACHVQAVILYDASLGTIPNEQSWTGISTPLLGHSNHRMHEGALILDTQQDLSELAGYFSKIPALSLAHPESPTVTLDEADFAIDFTMRVVSSSDLVDSDVRHEGERNRGGFAVIAISENLTGIELQFQHDQIIALDDADSAFPLGEAVAWNAVQMRRDYRLTLSPEAYRLTADGVQILTGPLRNYSGVAPAPPLDFPYTTPSFFFFGDDTPRGGAVTEITRFAVAPLGDCNHDGTRDAADFACLTTLDERDATLAALGTLPGDIDGDRTVSFADFLQLSAHFGSPTGGYAQGNLDMANGVDFVDFLILSTNFGKGAAEVVPVPEPQSGPGSAVGICALFACRQVHLRSRRTQRKGSEATS